MIYDFPDQYTGSTWSGVSSINITSGGIPLNLTNCEVSIKVRSFFNLASPSVLEFSNKDSTIVILNASQGTIKIPAQNINIPEGKYKYSLRVFTPPNHYKTYLTGIWNILPCVTRIPITTRIPLSSNSGQPINYIPTYQFTFTTYTTTDTDDDGYTDNVETIVGTDLNDPNSFPVSLFNVFNNI